ncbi:MAG: DUF1854 domain-containing protein [Verrucomicrobia bacterium]|nr:DUF1854 domain-containing protein [Verrucomicrobiota bacterium]
MRTVTNDAKKPEPAVTLLEASQLIFLDAKKLRFFKHGVALRLTLDEDRSYPRVGIMRAFPLPDPNRFLSVRDDSNKEVGLIANPAELSAENRELVEEELERRYLVPAVKRIVAAKERFGTVDWTMETDRGVSRFTTRNLRENVHRPSPGRIILNDVDGNRYDIRNVHDLSHDSQELLFRHM